PAPAPRGTSRGPRVPGGPPMPDLAAPPGQVVPDLRPGADPATIDRPIRHRNRPAKILDIHLDRLAVVYVRQSSPGQVAHHKESARIQRGLRDLAIAWGWPPHR